MNECHVLRDKKMKAPEALNPCDQQKTSRVEGLAYHCSRGSRKYRTRRTLPRVPDFTMTTAECYPSRNKPVAQRSNVAQMLVGDEGSHRHRHPMAAFDDLLQSFGDLIDTERASRKRIDSQVSPASGFRSAREPFPGTTSDKNNNNSRLFPRLNDSLPATVEGTNVHSLVGNNRCVADRMDHAIPRSMSLEGWKHLQRKSTVSSSPTVSPQHHDRWEQNEARLVPGGVLLENGNEDAFDIMLQSKNKSRTAPNTGRRRLLVWTDHYDSNNNIRTGTLLGRPSTEKIRDRAQPDSIGDTFIGDSFGDRGNTPTAGVFRVSHAGAGFIHYGYAWDIRGAKEDQLRQLNRPAGAGAHPHKGLSAIVRRHHQRQVGQVGRRPRGSQSSNLLDQVGIAFEVISRVRLPSRFRANEFEEKMKSMCARELFHRQQLCLLRMARHYYRRERCAPAFRLIRTVWRQQAGAEQNAAAVEIQRVWRGCRRRTLGRLEQKQRDQQFNRARRERVGQIVALWGQSRYRGKKGRLRAGEEKEDEDDGSEEQRSVDRAVAATAIQDWFRGSHRKRKEGRSTSAGACNRQFGGAKRGQFRPITPSEIQVAGELDEASRTLLLDPTHLQHRCSGDGGEPAQIDRIHSVRDEGSGDFLVGQRQRRRRPSSSREARDFAHPPEHSPGGIGRGRKNRRPSSAGFESTHRSTGREDPKFGQGGPFGEPSIVVYAMRDAGLLDSKSLDPDASRLVLEGDPRFTAAAKFQAAWRGFIVRLGLRKKRRTEAALRRKREGKWRQQRGVVGKQVSVGWDERRGRLEAGGSGSGEGKGGDERTGAGQSSCVDIQRVWRGAIGRKTALAVIQKRQAEMDAALAIQQSYRGATGRRRARAAMATQNTRIASAHLLTREGRRFVSRLDARRRRWHLTVIIIQRVARGRAGRRYALAERISRVHNGAARRVQLAARLWLGRRQARKRTALTRMGACALCCARRPEMYLATTEQELCMECFGTTATVLNNRRLASGVRAEAFLLSEHHKRQRAATYTQRAWLRFQQRATAKFGSCEACPRGEGPGKPRARAARAVCIAGCDHRRHLRYCRRCCAISHSLKATSGHDIWDVDRYGAEMAAAATLGAVLWWYSMKSRFWRVFCAHRRTLNKSSVTIQSRWRRYRHRSVFSALRRGFLYVEAAAMSVERYWLVTDSRDGIMSTIASFLAYDIQALPPGIYPAPSGHLALWETLVVDAVRRRAVTLIQRRWRDRLLRLVARALADRARQDMMERQRLQTLIEIDATVQIQSVWRAYRGRSTARRRAATLAFARETACGYTHPGQFAIANLRAFHAHGGYLGSAGVSARSLLAAAGGGGVGNGQRYGGHSGRPGGTTVSTRRARRRRRDGEPKALWLHLRQKDEDWGGYYAEEGYHAGISPTAAGITEVGVGIRLHRVRESAGGEGGGGSGDGTQSKSVVELEREESSGALLVAGTGEHAVSNTGAEGVTRGDLSRLPWLERETRKTQGVHRGGYIEVISGDPPPTLKLELICVQESDCNGDCDLNRGASIEQEKVVHQCEVTWCGLPVGGTSAPPAGLPVPRWEGQVFYLPLSAADASGGGAAKSPTGDTCTDENSCRRLGDHRSTADSGLLPPPLLAVTLNRLGGQRPDISSCGSRRSISPWTEFLSGCLEPMTVGRAVLEAGDVLSMLGSQQVVHMPSVAPRNHIDDDGGSGSYETHKCIVRSKRWALRLMLSLEERERTRTRLLVTEVVAGVVAEIIEVIPMKVPRIEVRVIGMRLLASSAAGSRNRAEDGGSKPCVARPGPIPALRLSAKWNGDHAGVVNLPSHTIISNTADSSMMVPGLSHRSQGYDCAETNASDLASAAAAESRLIVLPMHMPSIMMEPVLGMGKGGGSDDSRGVEGKSHRLRISVTSVSTASLGGRDADYGDTTPSTVTPKVQAEAIYFERDLLRREWTEILVPISPRGSLEFRPESEDRRHSEKTETGSSPSHFNENIDQEQERPNFSPKPQAQPDSLGGGVGGSVDGASAAVVLHVRARRFDHGSPPLWLLRRDFAERMVSRIVSAAAAAVVQPRVEMALLGVRGAISSLLSAGGRSEGRKGGSASLPLTQSHSTRTPILMGDKGEVELPGGGGMGEVEEGEVLCQAFWNGILAYELRLQREAVSVASAAAPGTRSELKLSQNNEGAGSSKRVSVGFNTDGPDDVQTKQEEEKNVTGEDLATACRDDEKYGVDPLVEDVTTRHDRNRMDENDPSTWFIHRTGTTRTDAIGNPPFLEGVDEEGFIELGCAALPTQKGRAILEPGSRGNSTEERRTFVDGDSNFSVKTIEREGDDAIFLSGGSVDGNNADETDAHRTTKQQQSFSWVPAKGERYGRQPFRFFLPASISDDAPGRREGDHVSDTSGCGIPIYGGSGINRDGDEVHEGSREDPTNTVKGVLRLLFWGLRAAPRSPSHSRSSTDAGRGSQTVDGGGKRAMTTSSSREYRGQRGGGEGKRILIGCAELVDDELLLQPPGEPVELALMGNAGLDTSTAWATVHGPKRTVHGYGVTEASVCAVIRHFDVPRGPILQLQCPSPWLEVEIIDAHRLVQAPGKLSSNPYVVLTMNGEPVARSSTSRGTASPVWSSEIFRVKMPPSTYLGAWHMTAQSYFRGYSGEPCILGAKVYSQAGPRAASARQSTSMLRGVCEDDVLLAEGRLPFSMLKELPFHYLPLKLYPPRSSPSWCPAACDCAMSRGGGLEGTRTCGSRSNNERGLLGIGVAMVFPNPSIPDSPPSPDCESTNSLPKLPSSSVSDSNAVGRGAARCEGRGATEIALTVHEAEALVATSRPGKSLNPYCVVTVKGREVARTRRISESCDPLWATEIHLSSDNILGGRNLLSRRYGEGRNDPEMDGTRPDTQGRKTQRLGAKDTGSDTRPPGECTTPGKTNVRSSPKMTPSPPPRDVVSSVVLEVWDDVPEGKPDLLGAAELPSDLMSALMTRGGDGGTDKGADGGGGGGGVGVGVGAEVVAGSRRVSFVSGESHYINLKLLPGNKTTVPGNRGGGRHLTGEEVTAAARKLALGVLIVSIAKRIVSEPSTFGGENFSHNGAEGEVGRDMTGPVGATSSNADDVGNGGLPGIGVDNVTMTRVSESALQRHHAATMRSLAETTRGAKSQLEEARAMVRDIESGTVPRGRSVHDCPQDNAKRYARAWARETWRAEQAESLAARRPTIDFQQETLNQIAKGTKQRGTRVHLTSSIAPESRPSTTRDNRKRTRSREARSVLKSKKYRSAGGGERVRENSCKGQKSNGTAEPIAADDKNKELSIVADRLKTPILRKAEDDGHLDEEIKQETAFPAETIEINADNGSRGGEGEEEGGADVFEDEEPSILERILPPLPASRREVFLRVEAFSGLEQPFAAKGDQVSAHVFWDREEVGRTGCAAPMPEQHAQPAVATTAPINNDGNLESGGGSSLLDKMKDVAATTAGAVGNLASIAGGSVTAKGLWQERQTFVLPLPDNDLNAAVQELAKWERAGQGGGDGGDDKSSKEDPTVDPIEGMHLRIEVWQGKHCHGEIELEGTELVRMCKKVQNATASCRANYTVVCGRSGAPRLPDHYPHFLVKPEVLRPYQLPLVPRKGEEHRRDATCALAPRLTLMVLALEPGQTVAAQAHLSLALETIGARTLDDRGRTAGSDPREATAEREGERGGVRGGGDGAEIALRDGALRPEATGIAQDIVRVLNENRSPLSFRLQALVLHLNAFDGGDASWREDGGSDLILVARREEFVPTQQAPDTESREFHNEDTHQTNGTILAAAAVAAVGQERQEAPEKYPAEVVVRQEELGRSYPFTVRSKTALVSGSIKIPPEALITDVQQEARGRKSAANQLSAAVENKGNHAVTRGESGQQKMTRIVLEVVQETVAQTSGRGGPVLSGMTPFNLIKSRLSSDGGAGKDNDAGRDGGRIVARAILDPEVLRRTIASQRSVMLMTTAAGAGRQSENPIQEEKEPALLFARLDVAGHAVCARPGPPHIRLEVMECQNLKQADVLGKSDPCVLVFWNGREIGRTPIARDDLNPVFLAPTSVFRLPLMPARIAPQHESSPETASDEGGQQLRLQTSLSPWMEYAPELRLEVWDMDRDLLSRKWKKGELLGTASMSGPSELIPVVKSSSTEGVDKKNVDIIHQEAAGVLLRLAAEESKNRERRDWLPKDGVAAPAPQVSAGVIRLKMTVEDPTDDTDAWIAQTAARTLAIPKQEVDIETLVSGRQGIQKISSSDDMPCCLAIDSSRGPSSSLHRGDEQEEAFLGVRCLDARGLPLGSNAYCRVFWNGRQVGKTPLASEMNAAHQIDSIKHCDDNANAGGGKGNTKDAPSPAVSASQRNPVWWKPYSPLLAETNGVGPNNEECGRSHTATVVVPLCEQSKGDELIVEVFDGRHRDKGYVVDSSTTFKLGIQCSDVGGSKHITGDGGGEPKIEQPRTDEGLLGSRSHGRDMVGRSLGSVTIRGDTLLCPPQGRIHLPLSPSRLSSASSNTTGPVLSISLERMPKSQEVNRNVAAQPNMAASPGTIQQNDGMMSTFPPTVKTTSKEDKPQIEETGHQPKRWMRLHLEGAQLKHGLDLSGTSDQFCTVYVNRVWHKETRVCWATLAPRWDQWIEIEICRQEEIEGFLPCPEIRVEVWDKNAFSADDFIGEATLFLLENQHGGIDVRTTASPQTGQSKVTSYLEQTAGRIDGSREGVIQRHMLDLCQERQNEAPRATCRRGGDGRAVIGTLSCKTLVYTEKNWLMEMDKMNLPWALGVNGSSCTADINQEDVLVLQLVGFVGTAGNQRLPPTPRSYVLPVCFAVVRWNEVTVGRTPCCSDLLCPSWNKQIFAIRSAGNPCRGDNSLEIQIYYADEKASHALGKAATTPLSECFLAGTCHLKGSFQPGQFSEYVSVYPVVLADHNQRAAAAATAAPNGRRDKSAVALVDHQTGADEHIPPTSGSRAKSAQPASTRILHIGDHGNDGGATKSPKIVGSISLRIGVANTAATPRVGGNGTALDTGGFIGEDDIPEIKRRRTNRVTRRVRLWVRWVSLSRLLREFSAAPVASDDMKGKTKQNERVLPVVRGKTPEEILGTHDARTCSPAGQNKANEAKHNNLTPTPIPASSASPLATISGVGLRCRVSWCGVRVATFEISPQTGVPITPGECLLSLPRGMAWSSCRLVLEVVATDQFMQTYPGFKLPQVSRSFIGVQCRNVRVRDEGESIGEEDTQRDTGKNTGGTTVGDEQTDNEEERGADRDSTLLGMIVVGWQALKSLKEHLYEYTTCPEDAVPAGGNDVDDGCNGGAEKRGTFYDVECSLCLPATTETTKSPPTGAKIGSGEQHSVARCATMVEDVLDSTTHEGLSGECGGVGDSTTWRILPSRLAISLRLERLAPSRPPRSLRMPSTAPTVPSVSRLRLSIAENVFFHASHPGLLLPRRRSLLDDLSAVAVVGWNGHDHTVGTLLEYQVPPAEESLGLGNDLLLAVPQHGRENLVLTVAVVKQVLPGIALSQARKGDIVKNAEGGGKAKTILGTATIDWDGLSCVRAYKTDYFVDPMDGRSAGRRELRSTSVNVELVASSSEPHQHITSSPRGTQLSPTPHATSSVKGGMYSGSDNDDDGGGTDNKRHIVSGWRTSGFSIRVNLQLEQSLTNVPYALSISPIAARGSSSSSDAAPTTAASVSLGDFRDPSRRERVPYLQFSWPWDDQRGSLIERRRSLVPHRPWRLPVIGGNKHRDVVTWPSNAKQTDNELTNDGIVSIHLPLVMSALDGSVLLRPGNESQQLWTDVDSGTTESVLVEFPNEGDEAGIDGSTGPAESIPVNQEQPAIVFLEAYDMGTYAPLEQVAAMVIQHLWRRALEGLRSARLWWEWDDEVRKYGATMRVQACFRGWDGRRRAKAAKLEAARRSVAAVPIQCQWRCCRARMRAAELRSAKVQSLLERQRLDEEIAVRRLAARRAGLSVLVARGAGLRGMDLSGLSDPFCVVVWNGEEVGRTAVRHSTRDPDWTAGDDVAHCEAGDDGGGGGVFDLPFYVPEEEKWGDEGSWPPMNLEIRCYDHDLLGPPELIGNIELDTDSVLALIQTIDSDGPESNPPHAPSSAPPALTWLEITADNDGDKTTLRATSALSSRESEGRINSLSSLLPMRNENKQEEERNPFDSVGDIALAVTAKRPLPASLGEYERTLSASSTDKEHSGCRDVVDAAVRAVMLSTRKALRERDRGLWVVNASGLCKADFFGKSDPYAKVFWDGREVGQTAVRNHTLNPVWVANTCSANEQKHAGPAEESRGDKPYFWLESARSVNPRLRVELYDWDAVGSHDFLGGVELTLDEVVELQRETLRKARARGGDIHHQMMLKTEFPLRCKRNKAGKNGVVGLCLFLDLEQQKRREKREQIAAALRQQAVDRAVAEVAMHNEATERKNMADEDTDAPDDRQQQLQKQSEWQVYYDSSYDPAVPWWYNESTGESTWDCPTEEQLNDTTASLALVPGGQAEEGQQQQQLLVAISDEPGDQEEWQMFHDESCDPPVPWWFNVATGESTWECPPAAEGLLAARGGTSGNISDNQDSEQHRQLVAFQSSDTGRGDLVGGVGSWTPHWSDEHQAYYYVNDATQESSWDPPENQAEQGEDHEALPSMLAASVAANNALSTNNNVVGEARCTVSGGQALGEEESGMLAVTSHIDINSSSGGGVLSFPHYVNERGNRVFCVPRK